MQEVKEKRVVDDKTLVEVIQALPALEAMAMAKLVICPFAVGNIDFCIPDKTCLQPEYNERALRKAVVSALGMDSAAQQQLIQAGKVIAANHDIKLEKERLLKLLEDADKIWQDVSLFKTR